MTNRFSCSGASLEIPDGATSTKTTTDDGQVTYRFFVDPVIVIAIGTIEPVAPALNLAAAIRAAYMESPGFQREASPQPDFPGDGVERGLLRFRWSARTGEQQASRVLVLRRADVAVAINATAPASRIDELDPTISEILGSVRLEPPAA
ncbi:MAG TPA: hypothetical protein GXZ30_02750 [Propionibacterium sp.]|jgi:hypothetical protein|nr:hypothetical protein [Propionibacterium sp.]